MPRFVLALIALALWSGAMSPAAAQSALERLEKEVRRQLDAAGGAPAKPDVPAAGKTEKAGKAEQVAAAEKPGGEGEAGTAAKPAQAQAYVGITVDDREDRGRGVRILRVRPGSPAEKAGLKPGDLITALGGTRVRQMDEAAAVLEQVPLGAALSFDILRGDKREKINVTFAQLPKDKREDKRSEPLRLVLPAPIEKPAEKPVLTPAKPAEVPAEDLRARIEVLERRIEQLERRVNELEKGQPKAAH